MKADKISQSTTLLHYTNRLSSPIQVDDEFYCVSDNGDILKISRKNNKYQHEVIFTILGSPSSICYQVYGNNFIVSDLAHESIFLRQNQSENTIHNIISEYNEHSFHGPHSMRIGGISRCLYFTDSGPFLQTSIQNPKGSLYLYHFEDKVLRPLSNRNLAYPTDIEIDEDQKYLLLCELGNNRILKFIIGENFSANYTVFHQFNGRLGPTSISFMEDIYYVTLFEFKQLADRGMMALLNKQGEVLERILLPVGPQITGLSMLTTLGLSGGNMCLLTEANNLHLITLKGDRTQSRDESILDKK